MSSDLLVLMSDPLDEGGANTVKNAIYGATTSAVVTFDDARPKVLLVRFDPIHDTPLAILESVRATGRAANMAGG